VELNQKRQDLLAELKGYERNTRALYSAGVGGETETTGTIPKDTKVNSSLEMNPEEGCGELVLSTNNDTVIKAAILFSEEIFEEEARFVYFPNPQRDAKVAIKPKKDSAADVAIKVLVSSRTSSTYHVFEVEFRLPRFCMYVPLKALPQAPASSVQVRIAERIVKIARWIDDAFMLQTSREVDDYSEECGCHMVCLRDSKPLSIRAVNAGDEGCDVLVQCDDMDTCGEVIQDMTKALGLGDVECTADFPYDMERLRETLTRVDEHNALRSRLVTDVADASITIKHLVIRAEDSRILQDWKTMKRMYGELRDLNRELIVEHQKRVENHEALLAALRDVNQTIQKAGKLRAGGPKTRMVAACRQAIKVNNVHALFKIIQLGADLAEQTSGFE
jgi:Bardet-Biedl syndrome 2 protein